MNYIAHFKDGSSSLIEIRGGYGKDLIGVATRGDGYKRVIFFRTHGYRGRDPWVDRVTACEAYRAPQLVHVRPSKSVVA